MSLTRSSDGDYTNTKFTLIDKNTTISLASTSFTNDGVVTVTNATLNINDTDFTSPQDEVDNGMINKGLMIAGKSGFIYYNTIVEGAGVTQIDHGGTVYIGSQVGISFVNPSEPNGEFRLLGGTLLFGASNEFYATITAMTPGSKIEFQGSNAASEKLTNFGGGLQSLTVFNASGGGLFTGEFRGHYQQSDFALSNSGGNGFVTMK